MPIVKTMSEKARAAIVPDNWSIRRRWMKWSIFWLAGNVEAIICWTIYAGGNALGVQLAMTLIGALVAIMMFYIFGATYDDHSKRQFGFPASSPDPGQDAADDAAADAEPATPEERPEKPPTGEQ